MSSGSICQSRLSSRSGAPASAATRAIAASASGGWANETSGTPRLAMAAFSAAISASVSPKILLMVDADAGDAGDERAGDDVGRVEAAAEPDLEDRRVRWRACESDQRRSGRHLEEARLDPVAMVEHFAEKRGEHFIIDQLAGDADALVEADEVGAGKGVNGPARCFDRGAEEGDRRAFAVGAGDMEHGGKGVLWPSQSLEQGGDALQAEMVAGRRDGAKAVELRLDAGMRRAREVHQAAAFAPAAGAR